MEVVEVGAKLRDARVARGLSLEDIAGITKVPRSMLQLLETDAFNRMPAPVFVRGFIRAFSKVVGIDPNPIVRAYEQRTASLEALAESAPITTASRSVVRPMSSQGATSGGLNGAKNPTSSVADVRAPSPREARDEREARDAREAVNGPGPRTAASSGTRRTSTQSKLTPLQPVSERREGSFRGGYALLAVVAIGLLIAAWLMVGGKRPPTDNTARGPGAPGDANAPALHERIEGVPSLDQPRARAGLGAPGPAGGSGEGVGGDEVPRVR